MFVISGPVRPLMYSDQIFHYENSRPFLNVEHFFKNIGPSRTDFFQKFVPEPKFF